MKTVLIIIFFLTGILKQVSAQENTFMDSLGCLAYHDTVLQKKVYKNAYPFPTYNDSTSIYMFGVVLVKEMGKDGFNFQFEPEEPMFRTSVSLYFVISEDGFMENIYIRGKTENEYTRLDKGVMKTLNRLKNHQWKSGECNGTKVPILVFIPFNLDFRGFRGY